MFRRYVDLCFQKFYDESNLIDFGWDENKGSGSVSMLWSDFENKLDIFY